MNKQGDTCWDSGGRGASVVEAMPAPAAALLPRPPCDHEIDPLPIPPCTYVTVEPHHPFNPLGICQSDRSSVLAPHWWSSLSTSGQRKV
ncbi:hypothetical protein EYF80_044093 [Liparis tanakae]|uniref:Uncharacterized protein n=1 Tax=Liparis tanakae TaxID=230148 RepID=A0A4Z2FZC0_9TELE|nr:hypothetical protein EYF80_044093 [Liparis tanakae]